MLGCQYFTEANFLLCDTCISMCKCLLHSYGETSLHQCGATGLHPHGETSLCTYIKGSVLKLSWHHDLWLSTPSFSGWRGIQRGTRYQIVWTKIHAGRNFTRLKLVVLLNFPSSYPAPTPWALYPVRSWRRHLSGVWAFAKPSSSPGPDSARPGSCTWLG